MITQLLAYVNNKLVSTIINNRGDKMIQRMIDERKDHDESQRELAKAIGYHHVQIARYERGTNTPPIDYIIKFCEHYHVSADYILGLPKHLNWPRELKK